jgi:hypothetical protein
MQMPDKQPNRMLAHRSPSHSNMAFQAPPKNLRQLNRYITTHDSHGKAVLSESITNSAPVTEINNGAMHFSLMYTNARSPQLTDGADIDFY